MTTRHVFHYLCFLFLVAFDGPFCLSADRPNFVLCMADDQGFGDMAYQGHPKLKTPNFDEMARTCWSFDRFYAGAPVCTPTRASVMTGRNPNRMGAFSWGYSLRPQEVTIAEALQAGGYRTAHFGKWHLGSVRADSPVSPGNSGFEEWLSSPNFFEVDPWFSHRGKAVQMTGEGSEIIVERALEFIKKSKESDRPFLTVIWFGSPHAPHVGTERDLALYANEPKKQQHFLAEITAMDRAMGRLRQGLRELQVAENTLLWYCSDNGAIAEGSTRGLRARKGSIYEGGLRVPALMEWPARLKGNRSIDIPACTVDIYPTLIELAGISVRQQPPLDGMSLVPWMDGSASSRRNPLGFWDFGKAGIRTPSEEWLERLAKEQREGNQIPADKIEPIDPSQLRNDYSDKSLGKHAAWLDGDWKLHRIENKEGKVVWELYHLAKDPSESRDVLLENQERALLMQTSLETWMRSVVASLNGADY